MAIKVSVPSCNVIIVPTPLHKYTQNIQTHIYKLAYCEKQTRALAVTYSCIHTHACMSVQAKHTHAFTHTL